MKPKFGVMGSAGGKMDDEICARARALGEHIAKNDCIIITGACPGLPHEAVKGARSYGGLVVGISPALSLDEHINRYASPYAEYDVLIFTGDGLMGREVESIRSCDIVAIVGGRSGTLGEFAIAYDEGKLIAVLLDTNGIAEHIEEIVGMINKGTGADLIYDADPERLVTRALEKHQERIESGVAYKFPLLDG